MGITQQLEQGQVLDNKALIEIFKCSPQGGMRRSLKTNTLVVVSNHVESIYDDRWIEDTFHYTGMGLALPFVIIGFSVFFDRPSLQGLGIGIGFLITASIVYFIGKGIAWIIDGFADDNN